MYSEILNRLDEETSLHNLTPRTCKAYRESVLRFLKYTRKDPQELTDDDARAYLLHKQQNGIKARTYNHYHGGIHFFYRYVLRVPFDPDKVPRMKTDMFLPTVLTRAEVAELLNTETDLKYKAMYTLMYSSGLRLSEVIHLDYEDISRKAMLIHVRKSKSRQDRYVILSKVALTILTENLIVSVIVLRLTLWKTALRYVLFRHFSDIAIQSLLRCTCTSATNP